MSSFQRLQWLIAEISSGRSAFVHFSHNASINREKIKFTLRTGYGQTNVYRPVLLSALNAVQMAMESGVVTDKGHSSKASGDSVIEFFIQQRLVRFNPSVEELVPAAASAMVSNIVGPTSPAFDVVLDSATPADSDEPTPVESALEEIRKALKENADRIQTNIEEYRGMVQQLANLSQLRQQHEDELAQARQAAEHILQEKLAAHRRRLVAAIPPDLPPDVKMSALEMIRQSLLTIEHDLRHTFTEPANHADCIRAD